MKHPQIYKEWPCVNVLASETGNGKQFIAVARNDSEYHITNNSLPLSMTLCTLGVRETWRLKIIKYHYHIIKYFVKKRYMWHIQPKEILEVFLKRLVLALHWSFLVCLVYVVVKCFFICQGNLGACIPNPDLPFEALQLLILFAVSTEWPLDSSGVVSVNRLFWDLHIHSMNTYDQLKYNMPEIC